MKKPSSLVALLFFPISILARIGPITGEVQLRLSPAWVRVADANDEKGAVESAGFSGDGMRIITGTKFYNNAIGPELWHAYAAEEIERVAFSPDDKVV